MHVDWITSDPVLSKGTPFQTNDPFHWHIAINILANTLNVLRLSVYTGDIRTSVSMFAMLYEEKQSKLYTNITLKCPKHQFTFCQKCPTDIT